MAESLKQKIEHVLQALERRYGKVKRHEFLPPPSSADMDAAQEVAVRNTELVAAAVLGLHGPPDQGLEAARKLMAHYVDWNEVRVASPECVARAMGRDPRAAERATALLRFLEAFFLRQRNMNLEYLVSLKPAERKQCLTDLDAFSRDELAAILLTCFGHAVFPPAEPLHLAALRCGLLKPKTTVLQMAKLFEDALDEDQMLALYSGLYAIANDYCHADAPACGHCPLKSRCPTAKTHGKGE